MFWVSTSRFLILFNGIIFYCMEKADVGEPVYFTLVAHEDLFRLYSVFLLIPTAL